MHGGGERDGERQDLHRGASEAARGRPVARTRKRQRGVGWRGGRRGRRLYRADAARSAPDTKSIRHRLAELHLPMVAEAVELPRPPDGPHRGRARSATSARLDDGPERLHKARAARPRPRRSGSTARWAPGASARPREASSAPGAARRPAPGREPVDVVDARARCGTRDLRGRRALRRPPGPRRPPPARRRKRPRGASARPRAVGEPPPPPLERPQARPPKPRARPASPARRRRRWPERLLRRRPGAASRRRSAPSPSSDRRPGRGLPPAGLAQRVADVASDPRRSAPERQARLARQPARRRAAGRPRARSARAPPSSPQVRALVRALRARPRAGRRARSCSAFDDQPRSPIATPSSRPIASARKTATSESAW